jgi:NHL repeat
MHKAPTLLLAVTISVLTVQAQSASSYVSRTIAGAFPLGDGGPATSALLELPQGVAADSNGTLYIADAGNDDVRLPEARGVE